MVKLVQNSFLGGVIDPALMGRQDIEKYRKGATVIENMLPQRGGGLAKRMGTNLMHAITPWLGADPSHVRLVPFAYTLDEGWVVVFTDGAARAYSRTESVEVTTDGSASLFTGAAVDEFDYCQSGDVMFLAHRDYPPARLEHKVATVNGATTHTFTLKKMDFAGQADGVPTIAGTNAVKISIVDKGGVVVEHYKATAVYDGVETVPSPVYFKRAADDDWDVSPDGEDLATKSAAATSYHAPWTQSQTITLYVTVPTKTGPDGSPVKPDEMRIYKKQGSGYGLIGVIRGDEIAEGQTNVVLPEGAVTETYHNTVDGVSQDEAGLTLLTDPGAAPSTLGVNRPGYKVAGEIELQFPGGVRKTSVRVRLCPGSVTYAKATAGGLVVMRYRPSNAVRWRISLGDKYKYLKTDDYGADVVSQSVSKAEGETEEAFDARWRAELAEFAAGIAAATSLEATVENPKGAASVVVRAVKSNAGTTASEYGVLNALNVYAESDEGESGQPAGTLSFVDNFITPDMSLTPPKEPEAMLEEGDWPGCVCLSRQRLIWAATKNDPARVIMSQVGDFYTYAAHETLVPDDPIDFQIAATRFPQVLHMVEMRRLIVFNGDAEWVVGGEGALTYETVQAVQHSAIGAAAALKPLACNNMVLFAERTGQAVRQYSYRLDDDGYGGEDVSIFAQSIFRDRRIVAWDYQQHPDSTCWCVLSDGTLATLAFNREQRTVAWATHRLGGASVVKGIAATRALVAAPGGESKETHVVLLVKHNYGGGAVWHLEELRPMPKAETDAIANMATLDAARTIAPGGTIGAGLTSVDLATGAVTRHTAQGTAGSAGAIAGFPVECRFRSVYPVLGDDIGQGQTDVKCVQSAHLRTMRSAGGKVWAEGVPEAEASLLAAQTAPAVSDGNATLAPVDETVELVTHEGRDGRVNVAQDGAWPFAILMMELDVEPEEGGRR